MYIVLDIESGGLIPHEYSLLTAAYILLDKDYKVLKERSFGFKPDPEKFGGKYKVCPAAMNCNKIDLVKLEEEGVELVEFYTSLVFDLQDTSEEVIPIGCNTAFDTGFLGEHVPWFSKLVSHRSRDIQKTAADMADWGLLDVEKVSLQALAKHFGIDTSTEYFKAHSALGDTRATLEVFMCLRAIGLRAANALLKMQMLLGSHG
jgi:DNA polymerase III epsilon subunit-like protein